MPSIVNYGGASSATRESHPELQKGIKLLRRSVGCICAYGFGLLSLSAPSDMPIFDALSELLTVLSMKESRTRLVTCRKTLLSLLFWHHKFIKFLALSIWRLGVQVPQMKIEVSIEGLFAEFDQHFLHYMVTLVQHVSGNT
jgi:hypothetical protein